MCVAVGFFFSWSGDILLVYRTGPIYPMVSGKAYRHFLKKRISKLYIHSMECRGKVYSHYMEKCNIKRGITHREKV